MQDNIDAFKQHVREISANPEFLHHKWFVHWHLEVVERIAQELVEYYPEANEDLVTVMVWLHDYGKIIDFENSYKTTRTAGKEKLLELGFAKEFVESAVANIELLDKKMEEDLSKANIEVQIVSSADGCSHMIGPFMSIFWHEATDKTFANKSFEELMALNKEKVHKDWNRKITLPEARNAFEPRYKHMLELAGELPQKILTN